MRNKVRSLKPWLYVLPAGLILLVFVLWPIVYTFYLSFFDWNMIAPHKEFVGGQNYLRLFTDPTNRRVIGNTLVYLLLLVVLNFVVPYAVSLVVRFFIQRMRGIYKVLFFIPSLFSLVVGAMLFAWLLNPISGPVALLLRHVGVVLPQWTASGGMAIVVVCFITNWKVFGYNFILLLSGLGAIPENVLNAARMDDVPRWRMIKDIVLPLNQSIAVYVLLLTVVQGLQYVFTPLNIITQGGPYYGSSNLIYHTYMNAFVLYKTGSSSAMAILTFGLFLGLLLIEQHWFQRRVSA